MDVARRLKLGLAALLAIAASGFFAVPAFADTQPDPQLSNIPYLAWRGEEVRLVKCFPFIPANAAITQTDFILVDWSGDPLLTAKPNLEAGTVSHFFRSFDGSPCVAGTFQSDKAGLAQIKLVVTASIPTPGTNIGPEIVTLKHDFLVGWMNINTVALNNVARSGSNVCPAGGALSPGPISETAGSFNCLRVDVTGQIPLLQDFSELGIGNSLVMPTDWAKLANAIATFQDPTNPNPAAMWDIHDDQSAAEGHSTGTQSSCTGKTALGFFDAVDNCAETIPTPATFVNCGGTPQAPPFIGGVPVQSEVGPFSRVWLGFTLPTIGPFDPQRPCETLLSNGVLDAGDAPMPSLRVDFTIGAGGVGSFCTVSPAGSLTPPPPGVTERCRSVDKHVVYSRNGLGTDPTATGHNLYAPFYAEYLPAAFPSPAIAQNRNQPEASGVAGALDANNFNGFLTENFTSPSLGRPVGSRFNFYHYWDAFTITSPRTFSATNCLQFVSPRPIPRVTPSGMTTAVVYTDEHGEARVLFSAGTGFFFNALPVNINLNGGCDLAGVTTLGTAPITATARYPFENVTARPVASNVLTKTITSAFSKTITCVPKGTGANNQQVAICFATAVDITGDVIPGETVCFTADLNAESIIPFPEVPGQTVTVAGTTLGPPVRNTAAETGTNMRCMVTNDSGNAAVEIVNSNATTVDVTAKFVEEGLFRFLKVTFPITQTVTSSGNAAGSSQTGASSVPAGGNNSSGSNTTAGSNSSGSNSTASNNPAVQYTIAVARLVRTAKGKATLIVRLKGPAGKANLLIKITGKHKTVAYQRAVVANRLVKIRGLRMPTKTGALRVSLSFVT